MNVALEERSLESSVEDTGTGVPVGVEEISLAETKTMDVDAGDVKNASTGGEGDIVSRLGQKYSSEDHGGLKVGILYLIHTQLLFGAQLSPI